jgi:hypothetical protein
LTSALYGGESRNSSVGIALEYGLDDRGHRVQFPAGAGNFSLHHRIQNGSGAHPTSYPMGTRGSFPGGEADHSPPSSAEVKNAWSYSSTPPIRLHGVVLTTLPLPLIDGGELSASPPGKEHLAPIG